MSAASLSPALPYRGRFAPSPTGPLHFGSLVAALASYCDARSAGGQWLVRIEDVDTPRSRRGAEYAILTALERYGFEWDHEIVRQSERVALYDAAIAKLVAQGDLYECACTRHDQETAPTGALGEPVYPRTCRAGISTERIGRARALRVDVDDTRIEYRDRLQGEQAQDLARDVGDFIVKRSDGVHAYQLAVVVDDGAQGISHVVRGADLLASTPRQIFLQRKLGYATPSYLHTPVATNAAGEKLSKQTEAAPLPEEALPVLVDVWRFLGQSFPPGSEAPNSVGEFWTWAQAAWNPMRIPALTSLAAPSGF